MRRKKQKPAEEECRAIIERANSRNGKDRGTTDTPYTVPVNLFRWVQIVASNSAKAGHKIDAIVKEPKVSFTFIDKDDVVSREFTTYFRSVQVFGKAHTVTG